MVIVRILGGLGNQLFSYAAARRLAHVNRTELVVDDTSGFLYDHDYRRSYQLNHFQLQARKASAAERMEPFSRVRRYLKRWLSRRQAFENRAYLHQEVIDFDARLLNVKPQGTVYLEGYWQSERYFKDVEEIIRSEFRIQPPQDQFNVDAAVHIRGTLAVALHVRFFDRPDELVGNNASVAYYRDAIAKMEALVPGAHYFVFSDRPDDALTLVPLAQDRVTLVRHNEGDAMAYADLWLMTQCRHFIIANSTFSWWGAWLAQSPGKHVIAPGFELRQGKMWWGFDGLLPHEWIKL